MSASAQTWSISLTEGKPGWLITPGTDADRVDALSVRYQVYCEELGYKWNSAQDEFDAQAVICVVRTGDGSAVASLRIVGPEARPFEVEKFVSIEDILPANSWPAELNRFCVLPHLRTISSSVHVALFNFAFGLARRQRFSHFVLASKPSIEAIYRFLLFEVIEGRSFRHSGMGDERHNLMLLDLRNLSERYRQARHPFAHLMLADDGHPQ